MDQIGLSRQYLCFVLFADMSKSLYKSHISNFDHSLHRKLVFDLRKKYESVIVMTISFICHHFCPILTTFILSVQNPAGPDKPEVVERIFFSHFILHFQDKAILLNIQYDIIGCVFAKLAIFPYFVYLGRFGPKNTLWTVFFDGTQNSS